MMRGPDAHQQRFAQLAWHFNCHIASLAHPSWLIHPQQASDKAWSAHLLARSGVARLQDWRLAEPSSRLWLLDTELLQSLQEALGGLIQRPQVARAVSKARRDSLRAQWSAVMWEAATDSEAPQLHVDAADLRVAPAAVPPLAAFVDAMSKGGSSAPSQAANQEQGNALAADVSVQRGAARVLFGLLAPSRVAVSQRARMRMPRAWLHDTPLVLPSNTRCELVDWIAYRWIPQRSASWAWLF